VITQVLPMVNTDEPDVAYRIVGKIDTDQEFFAYAEEFLEGEWQPVESIQYQRDSVSVPNLEYDPDVLHFFAMTCNLTKPGDSFDWQASRKLVDSHTLVFFVNGEYLSQSGSRFVSVIES